nr:DNA-directed RNA polymerases II, IV and V subunit 3-like [Ipomoea trifida]
MSVEIVLYLSSSSLFLYFNLQIVVVDAEAYTYDDEVLKKIASMDKPGLIEIHAKEDSFIFTVESTGAIKASQLVLNAIDILKQKLDAVRLSKDTDQTGDDLPRGLVPHKDALVIAMDWICVNILYMEVINKLGLSCDRIKPVRTPLARKTRDSVELEGSIKLPVELGTYPNMGKKEMRVHAISGQTEREELVDRLESVVKLEEVETDPLHPERKMKIAVSLAEEVMKEFIQVLSKN